MNDVRKEIQTGLFGWIDIPDGEHVLLVGRDQWGMAKVFKCLGIHAVVFSWNDVPILLDGHNHHDKYSIIMLLSDWEKKNDFLDIIRPILPLLKKHGRLYLCMNNRLGLRYFCGDQDPYTGQCFDGIDNYRMAYGKKEDAFRGRMYSQAEVRSMLQEAGFSSLKFYSVLPDLEHPAFLFAEDYLPNEDLAGRVFPFYHHPASVFLEEEQLYSSLIENGMFHAMANAYLVECSLDGSHSDVEHVTCSAERGDEYGLYTIIHASGLVEKKPISPAGEERLRSVQANMEALSARGIAVVPSTFAEGRIRMDFVKAPMGTAYLRDLLYQDKEQFLAAMDRFAALILQSSEHVREDAGDGEGVLLAKGYFDLVPLNCFVVDGQFTFIDQEFVIPNYPANVILTRMVDIAYTGNKEMQKILPMETLLDRYGLTRYLGRWRRMSYEFLRDIRNLGSLRKVYEPHQRNDQQVFVNRQRINYTEAEYQRLFQDIFADLEEKKLVVFGAGRWAQRFIDGYGHEHEIALVVDNQKAHWGKSLRGIPIAAPEELKKWPQGSFKVLICIKGYQSVMRQLDAYGIADYSIFDPTREYPRKPRRIPAAPVQAVPAKPEDDAAKPARKKYHIGYIAGVFDLFHVGHLNMFRRAKEQCDYLIVGVVSDEGVRKNKGVEPFIPFAERVEIVRACRYVDEAHEIPLTYAGTKEAWSLYHFDVQFSGSDYEEDPGWLTEKDYLEQHGATMVFFPYTQQTSSTKIKALINQRLKGEAD